MTLMFNDFFSHLIQNPMMAIAVILILGVVFVNGWTDAPNAIATCISTRAIKPKAAILMAAIMNFLGVFVMTTINKSVAQTIFSLVSFGNNSRTAILALSSAMFSIVIWAVLAWRFGIPTSESHALIAGISGAAVAICTSFKSINTVEWSKVIFGLVFSIALGFVFGYFTVRLISCLFKNSDRMSMNSFFNKAQIFGGAAMAFMHGAQDGQKFIGVFMLAVALSSGNVYSGSFIIPVWLMIVCSLVMGIGTSVGGYRIIKAVGMNMVKLEKYQGFSADIAGAFSLLVSSVLGLPVSTTHTKTAAIMGVGASKRLSAVNWGVVGEMVLTWVLTFPGCGFIGYLMAKLFLSV